MSGNEYLIKTKHPETKVTLLFRVLKFNYNCSMLFCCVVGYIHDGTISCTGLIVVCVDSMLVASISVLFTYEKVFMGALRILCIGNNCKGVS